MPREQRFSVRSYIALKPEFVLEADGNRPILYVVDDEENTITILQPADGPTLSLCNGRRTLGEVWQLLARVLPGGAARDVAEVLRSVEEAAESDHSDTSEPGREGVFDVSDHKLDQAIPYDPRDFGGEPLLAFDLLLRCTEGFRARALQQGFDYCAEIVTNGLLLQRAGILRDLHRLHLVSLQISLDGLPATYAARKEHSAARATRFSEFVADAVGRLADGAGQITLSVNVDRQNVGEAREVVDFFVSRGGADPRVIFKLGRLSAAPGSADCIPHDCLETDSFTTEEIIFREHLAFHGPTTSAGVPEPTGSTCGATLRHQYSVDPFGRIGKCVPLIGTGEDTVSVIHPGDIARTVHELTTRPHPFAEFDPHRAAGCRGCHLLPVCLGSCPRVDAPTPGACQARSNLERQVLASVPH